MRGFAFRPVSNTGDWHQPFYVVASQTNYVPDEGTQWVPGTPPAVHGTQPNYPPTMMPVHETVFVDWYPPDDEVLLGMSPDMLSWEDYGRHRQHYPPGRTQTAAPYFRASSNDGSGYISLISPGLIDILIPASVMRSFPQGEINVGVRYQRASDQRTSTLFIGRLPILHGVV